MKKIRFVIAFSLKSKHYEHIFKNGSFNNVVYMRSPEFATMGASLPLTWHSMKGAWMMLIRHSIVLFL